MGGVRFLHWFSLNFVGFVSILTYLGRFRGQGKVKVKVKEVKVRLKLNQIFRSSEK